MPISSNTPLLPADLLLAGRDLCSRGLGSNARSLHCKSLFLFLFGWWWSLWWYTQQCSEANPGSALRIMAVCGKPYGIFGIKPGLATYNTDSTRCIIFPTTTKQAYFLFWSFLKDLIMVSIFFLVYLISALSESIIIKIDRLKK